MKDQNSKKEIQRLPIVRPLLSSRKIKRVHVLKNGVVRELALEKTSHDRWRDQTNHFWMFNAGDTELIAAN